MPRRNEVVLNLHLPDTITVSAESGRLNSGAKVHDLEHSIHKRLRSPLRPVWFRLGASVMFSMQEGITWVPMHVQLSLCSLWKSICH